MERRDKTRQIIYTAVFAALIFAATYAVKIPTFTGEPERVAIGSDLDAFAEGVWESLDAANKIALYVGFIDLKTYRVKTRLFNKHVG